jgi:hypothetical protein
MQTFYFPQEEDFRRWIRESVKAEVQESLQQTGVRTKPADEPLLSRRDMAAELAVSLVTLTDWMKKGLPYLRMNGRVYFRRSEVIESMSHNKLKTGQGRSHGK